MRIEEAHTWKVALCHFLIGGLLPFSLFLVGEYFFDLVASPTELLGAVYNSRVLAAAFFVSFILLFWVCMLLVRWIMHRKYPRAERAYVILIGAFFFFTAIVLLDMYAYETLIAAAIPLDVLSPGAYPFPLIHVFFAALRSNLTALTIFLLASMLQFYLPRRREQ
jgi:hypothetical protein